MLKKIRIRKLGNEGEVLDDRLVAQDSEFMIGPKETHDGPLCIEVTLSEQADIDKFINYLQKLTGSLPIIKTTPGKRGRKPIEGLGKVIDENFRERVIDEAMKASKNQDDFIKYLRNVGFVFVESDRLKTIIPESYEIKPVHLKTYQWMLLQTKLAKNPKADKFDPSLLVGITILPEGERKPKMVLYKNGKYSGKDELPVPTNNPLTFMETNLIKYPHYLTYEEREKWGIEHRLLLDNPEKQPSKFYNRWAKEITVPTELQLKTEK